MGSGSEKRRILYIIQEGVHNVELKALVLDDGLHLRDMQVKSDTNDQVIAVKRAGICGTDIAITSGDYMVHQPIILGHEIFGVVSKGGEMKEGERVVSEINVYCERCYFCRKGMKTHCKNIQTLGISRDGGFAEFLAVPARNLHRLPDSLSDEEGAFVEPLAASIQLTVMSEFKEGETALIIGSGRMALLIVQVLKNMKLGEISMLGRNRKKLELASQLGAMHIFEAEQKEECMQLLDWNGFDHVIEATGNEDGFRLALEFVRPRGVIHVKSTHGLKVPFDITKAVVKEVRIQGSRCGPFEDAIRMIEDGMVDVKRLLTHTFSLEDYEKAFETARGKDAVKVQFKIQ